MSAHAYVDQEPDPDGAAIYSLTGTYPPRESSQRFGSTPTATAYENAGHSYDEEREDTSWRSAETEDLDVHLASEAEKKRLWWRNAVINTIFIAAWYVLSVLEIVSTDSHFSSHSASCTLFITLIMLVHTTYLELNLLFFMVYASFTIPESPIGSLSAS